MKKGDFLLIVATCLLAANGFAQNPLVKQWDHRFGGTGEDSFTSFGQTSDSGYILGGFSLSGIGGDKSQSTWGSADYWVIKLDSLGIIQWDKSYGGTADDQLSSVQQTKDGGYIIGGYSQSNVGGNKTSPSWGGYDYWILKLDALGNKIWEKNFGSVLNDFLYQVRQTRDGGYILGGYSNGNADGDKTQPNRDPSTLTSDYWILKIDTVGTKQWDMVFGGDGEDELLLICHTTDNGYVLGGFSQSDVSGDKTQPLMGGPGDQDYWILKTDSSGIRQWDKSIGGLSWEWLSAMQETADKGFVLAGHSWSDIGGNKSQNSWGAEDYWIVKTDSSGTILWDKDFGGTQHEDYVGSVYQTIDGGYLIAGNSESNIGGDKTEDNLAPDQEWVVKLDSAGNKQWDKTIFVTPDDKVSGYAIQSNDGCYLMAKTTYGGIAGYKSEANRDTTNATPDYWILKFCDTTLNTSLSWPVITNQDFKIHLAPNPTTGKLIIPNQYLKIESIHFYSLPGEKVFSAILPKTHQASTTLEIDISSLPCGIYLVQAIAGDKIFRAKAVKE